MALLYLTCSNWLRAPILMVFFVETFSLSPFRRFGNWRSNVSRRAMTYKFEACEACSEKYESQVSKSRQRTCAAFPPSTEPCFCDSRWRPKLLLCKQIFISLLNISRAKIDYSKQTFPVRAERWQCISIFHERNESQSCSMFPFPMKRLTNESVCHKLSPVTRVCVSAERGTVRFTHSR